MAYPYIIQGNNIVVVIGSKSHTITKSHVAYERVKEAIKTGDWETVKDIAEPKKVVLEYGSGNVSIQGETLYWKGQEMHNALTQRMISMLAEGFPIEPFVLFMENLQRNPSHRAVNELYGFLEKNNLPITPDGHFLAYKRVRNDYYDVHSGSVPNKPAYMLTEEDKAVLPLRCGKHDEVSVRFNKGVLSVSMSRNQVDDDKDRTCSKGLHFCSQEYLGSFGGERIMILKVNPRDVVSIPSDYNDSKGRCCRYEVVGELGVDASDAFTSAVQETANVHVSRFE